MAENRDVLTLEWTVSGMDCGSCAGKVRDAVGRMPGVSNVSVTLMSEKLRLSLDPSQTLPAGVEAAVQALGYGISAQKQKDGGRPTGGAKRDFADDKGPVHIGDRHLAHDHADGVSHSAVRHLQGSGDDGHAAPGHMHNDPADRGKRWFQTGKGRLVIFTGALLAAAWAFEHLTNAEYGKWAFIAACLIGVAPVAKRAFSALRMGQPFTIESLMTIAAIGALFIDAAEEAALVVFLFAVGEVLEGVAANKARDGIRALANLVPRTALRFDGDTQSEVAAETLEIGQMILVRPGDRVAADGEILEGTSGVDDSPVTGESVPVTKGPGDMVFAGSINTEAALKVRVTKAAQDNTISRIIKLVEEAEEARAPTERFIDRFSRWYMPLIVVLSVLVILVPPIVLGGEWNTWIYRGLTLLLIGCPCALVISVPASIASALSTGAKRGLLMKGGAVIEAAASVRRVAFDKTGTLTHGRPVVTDIVPLGREEEPQILSLAAAVESGSSHPLALAILNKAKEGGAKVLKTAEAKAIPGKGVEALVDGVPTCVANPKHAFSKGGLDPKGLEVAGKLEMQGKTVAVLFRANEPLALIAMRDEPRADAVDAVNQLKAMGITSVILTGDNPRTAAAVAGSLGMEFRAEMMPEDKLTVIREFVGEGGVMMIGDGINDAPALKQASVGVAMGSGTDVALETADAAILRDRVTDVPSTIRLSRATMANIRQNVAIALGLKAVFLVTSVFGLTGLWIAILADTGATVLVTLNALRLLAFDPGKRA